MAYNRTLLNYAPKYYEELLESREIFNEEDVEFTKLYEKLDEFLSQTRVSTATWGLSEWERICGLPIDETRTIAERRSNVIARLRGLGVINASSIRNIALSYAEGDVEVTELYSQYKVRIEFTNSVGIPPNVEDLQAELRVIMPAHLEIEYKFNFNTYSQLVPYTHAQLAAYRHSDLREEDIL